MQSDVKQRITSVFFGVKSLPFTRSKRNVNSKYSENSREYYEMASNRQGITKLQLEDGGEQCECLEVKLSRTVSKEAWTWNLSAC